MGVCAASRIIIPIKADDMSRIAIDNLVNQIFGPTQYQTSFAKQAELNNIKLPVIYLVISNQLTAYMVSTTKKYAKGYVELCVIYMYKLYQERPSLFSRDDEVNSQDMFNDLYFREIRDFNTAGIVSHHLGVPFNVSIKSIVQFEEGVDIKIQKVQWKAVLAQLTEIVKYL